jgi:hypothetical protein
MHHPEDPTGVKFSHGCQFVPDLLIIRRFRLVIVDGWLNGKDFQGLPSADAVFALRIIHQFALLDRP